MRIIKSPDSFRNNIRIKLQDFVPDAKNSKNLEIGIYNYALKEANNRKIIKKWDNPYFVKIYVDQLRSIYLNLQKNPHISEQIDKGEIRPHKVAFMTHQEMSPQKWDTLIDAKIKRDKIKYETNMEAATDTFKCRKCHTNKCTYYQLQTRSADEPMTTFVTCLECGNRWKC
jgi:transcription elongation factor S-II